MSVQVCVRCRPFNRRERKMGCKPIVRMEGDTTFLHSADTGLEGEGRPFTFDHSFWSHDRTDDHFASQADVWDTIGPDVLKDAFNGYNSCIFAYGQTGAGKSYTMMGSDSGSERGVTPRLCQALFERVEREAAANPGKWSARVEVSYMEIYMEKVHDLLAPPGSGANLRVREHKTTGPYVEGLTSHAVTDFACIKRLIDQGNKMRTTQATKMNDVSSRSHAIFQLVLRQTSTKDQETRKGTKRVKMERSSKLSLVDLAGSERSGQINAKDKERLKEGNLINRSLSTLGQVIKTLADGGSARSSSPGRTGDGGGGGGGRGKKGGDRKLSPARSGAKHVPYRDSVLTWLLRESLGGNSKTTMLAAISPHAANYEETLSTLRYAYDAKRIVNKAVVNEDATATMVRKLNEEIEELRSQLVAAQERAENSGSPVEGMMGVEEVAFALEESEMLMEELTKSWEDKLTRTLEIQATREESLRDLGIVMFEGSDAPTAVLPPRSVPYLMNLIDNPLAHQQCLVYYLREGVTTVVRKHEAQEDWVDEATPEAGVISLLGEEVLPVHCQLHCVTDPHTFMPVVSIVPAAGATVHLNDELVSEPVRLQSGDIVSFADINFFRFDNPEEMRLVSPSALRRAKRVASDSSVASGQRAQQQAHPRSMSTGDLAQMKGGVPSATPSLEGALHHEALEEAALASSPDCSPPNSPLSSAPNSPLGRSPPGSPLSRRNGGAAGPAGPQSPLSAQRPTPLGATEEVLAEQERELARTAATFEYRAEEEEAILSALITDISPRDEAVKLLPAYAAYLMVRHCQRACDVAGAAPGPAGDVAPAQQSLVSLLSTVGTLVKMTMLGAQAERDVAAIAFWLANASELVMTLRSDMTLAMVSGQAVVMLTHTVHEAFDTLVDELNLRICTAVGAVLTEEVALPADGATTPGGAASPAHGAAAVAERASVRYIVDSLDAMHALLSACMVNERVIAQLFNSVFARTGALLFNAFVGDASHFTWRRGVNIKFNLNVLREWARTKGLDGDIDKHFAHILQGASLLQLNKSSLAHLDYLCQSCGALNSLQVDAILSGYRLDAAANEEPIPRSLIDSAVARQMHSVDPLAEDDESVQYRLRLKRNPDYTLPFRLSGQFHMQFGLTSKPLLALVKDRLRALSDGTRAGALSALNTAANSRHNPTKSRHSASAFEWASLENFQPVESVPCAGKATSFF